MRLKKNQIIVAILFLLITVASLFLRFRNYEEMINFHLDPPLFMHEVKDMVDQGRIRLIGPMVSSKVVEGRVLFTAPYLYWLLAVLGIVASWNVVLITGFFAFLWMVTFILLFFWLKKRFGVLIALIVYALLSLFWWLLPYSRIIWNPSLIPFFATFFFWCLEEREKKHFFWFLAGLAFGLAISVHYASIVLILAVFYHWWQEKRKKLTGWLLFGIGALFTISPLLLFELRHDFYNLRTIILHLQYFQPSESYTFGFRHQYYYYLFPFMPLLAKLYGLFLEKVKQRFGFKFLILSQLILIVFFFAYSLIGPKREALINPVGWTIERQKLIADLIVQDSRGNFEVAALVGPETRANELRWWLRMKNRQPLGVEDYEKTDILYLVAPLNRPPEKETVWEVRVLRPFETVWQKDLGGGIYLYKLVRQKKEPVLK